MAPDRAAADAGATPSAALWLTCRGLRRAGGRNPSAPHRLAVESDSVRLPRGHDCLGGVGEATLRKAHHNSRRAIIRPPQMRHFPAALASHTEPGARQPRLARSTRVRAAAAWGIIALAGTVLARAGVAQDRALVSERSLCASCRVELTQVATLGTRGELTVGQHSVVALGRDGRFYIGEPGERGTIAILDSAGHVLKTFGRYGDGPGEMRSIQAISVADGDTVAVFGARLTLFTRNGRFLSSRIVPGQFQIRSALPAGDRKSVV